MRSPNKDEVTTSHKNRPFLDPRAAHSSPSTLIIVGRVQPNFLFFTTIIADGGAQSALHPHLPLSRPTLTALPDVHDDGLR